ncbi:zinc finger protein 37 homolog [Hylaeus anthracinus]|uniref:zinc finger protein 37 homolog n=1 Tax=Hylaeus anthracinus TaxID=313031 RepID=UPI0023B92C5C|nr:zinc finger protein 37 homolog [Hylaeus anthracinus]XP_053996276.1 zinc finger protein 37 homolog [Hylaeus anthracinus]XP_053996277.1 zinc finger protein 37 homolog [Hylaeus anthracinus]
MSFMNDDRYKKMVSKEIIQTPCTIEESSTEFMVLPKYEHIEETLVVGEEIVVDENMDINQQISEGTICEPKEYFEASIETTMPVEYVDESMSLSRSNINKQKWLRNHSYKHEILLSETEDSDPEIAYNKITCDDQYGDEETIATFVTAAGQQLALYAVEDSDEIFAVAMYDESGEPPTNFQFLMKADVERLIGEGAVRTVKKPTQIKKQLLTTQPPMFFPKCEQANRIPFHNENGILSREIRRIQKEENTWEENSTLIEDSDLNLNVKEVPNIMYSSDNKQTDVAYLMMDDCSVNMDNSEDCQEDNESDNEIIEQSTVQYILFEGDQSDSELTFDEIQATLKNFKTAESKSSKKQPTKKGSRNHDNFANIKEINYENSLSQNSNSNLSNHNSNTLMERKLNLIENQGELETLAESTMDAMSNTTNLDLSNGSIECTSPKSTQMQCKTKRSRKQQLIFVNREDSEIIIQPASLLCEEDNNVRKRGKRKRRVVGHSGYRQRHTDSKRLKRIKHKEVEIIEIDVDEEESILQSKRDVVEITIDDTKDKYSSDKENEIIMVGDSDDESQQANSKTMLLQCEHCSRNFRQQRALETHLRVCSKSPSNTIRFNEQKVKHANRSGENTIKKQYACKICQTKFDVVVALARHVRSEHSQRKKRRFSDSSVEQPSIKVEKKKEPVEPKKQLTMIKKIKRKRSQRLNCTWEVKKLSCSDCGRWFPSAALLMAHCLQHGTKKSDRIHRCHVCQKLIKSRLRFVQHLKQHGNIQKNTKSIANIQKKLHTTRSVTSKITTLRKRGRPRKL